MTMKLIMLIIIMTIMIITKMMMIKKIASANGKMTRRRIRTIAQTLFSLTPKTTSVTHFGFLSRGGRFEKRYETARN